MKIAHLADVHLGFRQYHRQTSLGINQREADLANAFRIAIDGVLAVRPDAVVLAGDLFHSVRPSNAAIIFAFRQLQRLREGLPGVPIVLIAGNHDTPRSSETGSILRLYEELGLDVAMDEPRRLVYSALDLSVLAVPHQALRAPDRPALHPEGSARHQVLVLHGEVAGVYPAAISGAAWGGVVVRPEELHADEWGYVALGHYHVQHQVDAKAWYAGALEYSSANPWGEVRDEERHGHHGKGWLLADLTTGQVARQPVPLARRVIDLPPLDAEGLRAEDLDRLIRERLLSIPNGLRDQIVRQVVYHVPRDLARSLDHATIRAAKAEALHFHLDLRRPEERGVIGLDGAGRQRPLSQVLRDFLAGRPLPAEIDREGFVERGVVLLETVTRDEEG